MATDAAEDAGRAEQAEQVCALAWESFDLVENALPGLDIRPVRAGFDGDRVIIG